MPQSLLLEKFSVFSEMNYEQKKPATGRKKIQVKREKRQIDITASLERGHCFGFSLNYVAHHHFGKRIWWKSLLNAITKWDGTEKALNKPVYLPDVSPESTEVNGRMLGKLINRAMNYVLPTQAFENLSLLPDSIDQENVLGVDAISVGEGQNKKSYFEYLHDGKIYSIKQHKKIAGCLSKKLLLDIFNEESLKNCLILIHSHSHTIGLAFIAESTWLIYDPNYDHAQPDAMEKTGTIEQCIDEGIRILGDGCVPDSASLTIEFASFDSDPILSLSAFEEAKKSDFMALFLRKGFFHCAKVLTSELISYLEEAYHSPETRDRVIETMKDQFACQWSNGNGFWSLLWCDDSVLLQLLKMGKESIHYDDMRRNIMMAIAAYDKKKTMVLANFIKYTDSVISILDFLVTDKTSLIFVMNLFTVKQSGDFIWSLLKVEEKEQLVNLFLSKMTGVDFDFCGKMSSSENTTAFPELLLGFMNFQLDNYTKKTVFEIILNKTPEALSSMVQLVLGLPDGFDRLTEFFCMRSSFSNPDNWYRLSFCPVAQAIMTLFVQHIHQMDLATLTKNHDKICVSECGVYGWLNRSGQRISGFSLFLKRELMRELASYKLDTYTTKKRKCGP